MHIDNLRQQYSACTKCPALCKSRTQVVFGSGSSQAQVLFLGEAPGASEDREGVPFCGASGKVLSELLGSIGLSREDIFITNTILCRPDDNRNPAREEVENCRERLDQLIQVMQPKVIVTIGNFATERILGRTGINSIRGKVFSTLVQGQEIQVVPVVHPASYLYSGRNPGLLEKMKEDFRTIKSVVAEEKKQKNLADF